MSPRSDPTRSSSEPAERQRPSPAATRAALARLLVAGDPAADGDAEETTGSEPEPTPSSLTPEEATAVATRLAAADGVETLAEVVETVGEARLRAAVDRAAELDPGDAASSAARETLTALTTLRVVAADHFRSGHATGINAAGEGEDR